ncbi:MAG: hypothetical protein WCG55_04610 [bacterium]
MTKFFEEKPNEEDVTSYENRLNYFLQYLSAKVKITLRESPLRMESYIDNQHTDTTYSWIDSVVVTTPEITIETYIFSQLLGHDGKIFDEKYAWTDALEIQENIYKKLNRIPKSPVESNDVYWKLWELNKSDSDPSVSK